MDYCDWSKLTRAPRSLSRGIKELRSQASFGCKFVPMGSYIKTDTVTKTVYHHRPTTKNSIAYKQLLKEVPLYLPYITCGALNHDVTTTSQNDTVNNIHLVLDLLYTGAHFLELERTDGSCRETELSNKRGSRMKSFHKSPSQTADRPPLKASEPQSSTNIYYRRRGSSNSSPLGFPSSNPSSLEYTFLPLTHVSLTIPFNVLP